MAAYGGQHIQGIHPGVRAETHADAHPSGLECSRTSARMPVRSNGQAGVRPAPDRIACPKGFSAAQVNVISLLLHIGPSITQHALLATELGIHYGMERTPEAIRRTVERLVSRGFARRRQTREGTMHGVSFAIVEDRLCPHIRPPVRHGIQADVRADEFSLLSILEEKERKNLSISSGKLHRTKLEALAEEDISFHWPKLSSLGFGTAQIQQIIQRREQVCESVDLIMQGLTFAEWELAHQVMKDAKGNAIATPVNWVFSILATQGYYPRLIEMLA